MQETPECAYIEYYARAVTPCTTFSNILECSFPKIIWPSDKKVNNFVKNCSSSIVLILILIKEKFDLLREPQVLISENSRQMVWYLKVHLLRSLNCKVVRSLRKKTLRMFEKDLMLDKCLRKLVFCISAVYRGESENRANVSI